MGREEEVSCPYLDLHLDLQVSPVDGEQCAVRAGGAQLPGAVGRVPVAVSQEDQWGEGGDLAGEGARTQHTHTRTPHTSQHHTHLHSSSHLNVMLMGGPVVFPGVCGGCPSPAPPPCSCCSPLAVVEAPRVSGG